MPSADDFLSDAAPGADDFLSDAKLDAPQPSKNSAWEYLTGKNIQSPTMMADPLGSIASVGQKFNNMVQNAAGSSAEALGKLGVPDALSAIPGTIAGTASEFMIPQNRLGAAFTLMGPMSKLSASAQGAEESVSAATKPGFIANLGQAMTRIKPSETQYYLDHPEEIMNAPSIEEASQAYKNSIGDLGSKAQSLSARLNKTILRPGDFDEAINRAGRLLNGTELDKYGNTLELNPQDALEGIQSINQAIRNKEFTQGLSKEQFGLLYDLKNGLMDYMKNNGSPGLKQAAVDLFKAHIKEDFMSWVPKNKYGSTDALRTWITAEGLLKGMGGAGALALSGHLGGAAAVAGGSLLGAASISPRIWGMAINNASALTRPPALGGLSALGIGASNYRLGDQPQK